MGTTQSAVEFAVNKLANLIPSGNQILIRAILIEAKEMEKQQQGYSQLDVVRILSKYETLSNEDFNQWFEKFKKP
jgi:hypothetical protein